jgi:hypothetical protein
LAKKTALKFTRFGLKKFSLPLLWIACALTQAAPVCHDVHQGGNPIAEQRVSPTFTGATQSSCQSGSPEYYVTSVELFQEIQFSEETDFCPTHNDFNSAEEDRICDGDNLFRFTEHSDKLPLFIEQTKDFLGKIELPASFTETQLSDDEKLHYQSIIYFCTRSFSKPLIEKINSPALSIEDRLSAFNELKRAGLLHTFSNDALRLILDSKLEESFKKEIIFAYLDQPELAAPFVGLKQKALRTIDQINERAAGAALSPRMSRELERQQNVSKFLDEVFSQYVEAEHTPQQLTALNLMAGISVPGADSAALILERSILSGSRAESSKSIASTSPPSGAQGTGNVSVLHQLPNCSGANSSQISSEDYLNIEQIVFAQNDQLKRSEINFNQVFLSQYSSDVKWTNLLITAPEKENLFEKFFCFQAAIKNSNDQLDQLTSAEADAIFLKISSIPGSIANLGALANLLPKLSRSEYLKALQLIGTSSNNILEVDEFKAQVLFNEFQRVTQNGSNLSDTELSTAIVEALGQNSGFAADEKLSEIFSNTEDTNLRMSIIQAYRNPTFARFGARLNIFHTLFEFSPEQRRPYAQALAQVVQENYTTLQATGGANNSSGSLSATEGQIDAALAAVMTLNSERTGSLNDGLEQVLTSDGVTRIRSRRAPIARTSRSLLQIEDPDIREQTEQVQVAANAVQENLENQAQVETSNPFEAFNQILDDQRSGQQESDNEFIPDADYLARVTGEKTQKDNIGDSQELESIKDSSTSTDNQPFIPVSPTATNSSAYQDSQRQVPSAFQDSQAPTSESSYSPTPQETLAGSTRKDSSFTDTASQQLQSEIESLKTQNSNLIGRIEKDNFQEGRLSNKGTNTPRAAAGTTSARTSRGRAASSGIASASAPSVSSSIPSSRVSSGAKTQPTARESRKLREEKVSQQEITEPLLSPRQEINHNEKGRVIKIKSSEQKLEFLNYMSAKSKFSCEEIEFIESFYKEHSSFFFLVKKEEETSLFANVEIDQMTYRFDYPGDSFISQAKPEACSPKKAQATAQGTTIDLIEGDDVSREPASLNDTQENEAPTRRESIQDIIFNKFKDKFGL